METIAFYKMKNEQLLRYSVIDVMKRLRVSLVVVHHDTCVFVISFSVPLFHRYDIPQYGSQRRLITPVYDEYGEVIMEDDGYYYGPRGPEVLPFLTPELGAF